MQKWFLAVLTLILVFSFNSVFARDSEKMFLSVGTELPDLSTQQISELNREACQLLQKKILHARGYSADATCASLNLANKDETVEQARASGNFKYHIQLIQKSKNKLKLSVSDWTVDKTGVERKDFTWNLESPLQTEREQALLKLLRSFFFYELNKEAIKDHHMRKVIPESKRLRLDEQGNYVDRTFNRVVPIEEAVRIFVDESATQKHYLRAALEVTALLGVADGVYWMGQAEMAKDWHYQLTTVDQKKKILETDGIRFDDNTVLMNFGHALAGYTYATACRGNGLTSLESFLCAFVASSLWEVVAEYHEVISINDMVVTPWGGWIISETLFQMGRPFNRGANTLLNKTLGWIFGTSQRLNNWIDKMRPQAERLDEDGYPADTWHEFELVTGAMLDSTRGGGTQAGGTLGVDMQIFNLEDYGKAGQTRKLFTDTAFADFVLKTSIGAKGLSEVYALTKMALGGYYKQDVKLDEKERLNGYSFFIGPANEVEFKTRSGDGSPGDMQVVVGVIGSTLKLDMYVRGVRIRMNIDVYGDFSLMRSYALDDYIAENGDKGIKSVQAMRGYAYGVGATPEIGTSVAYKNLEMSAKFKQHYMESLDSRDQKWEEIDRDTHASERYSELAGSLSYSITPKLKLRYTYEYAKRKGSMDRYTKRTTSQTHKTELVYLF